MAGPTEEYQEIVMRAVTPICQLVSDVVLELDAQHPQLDIALKILDKFAQDEPPHEAATGSLQHIVYWRFAQILCGLLRKTPGKIQ